MGFIITELTNSNSIEWAKRETREMVSQFPWNQSLKISLPHGQGTEQDPWPSTRAKHHERRRFLSFFSPPTSLRSSRSVFSPLLSSCQTEVKRHTTSSALRMKYKVSKRIKKAYGTTKEKSTFLNPLKRPDIAEG